MAVNENTYCSAYSVSFVLGGGTILSGEIDHYIEGETTALPTFVLKDGASFEGWYTTEDFTGDRYYFIPSTATEDMTFYAKWGAAKTVFYLNQDSPEPVNVLYEGENIVWLDKTTMFGYSIMDNQGNGWGGFESGINVPYTGGESTFGNGGREFNVSQSGFYVFTLTDKGEGNWFISVLYPLENYCTVSDIPDQTYTGSAICPEISVTDGETTLTLGTDYTIEYSDNTNVGTATVTVTGIGNYAGTIEKTFTIVKATPAVTAPTAIENIVYSGEPQPLVTAGTTDFGTLLYSLEENGTYAADIPTATAAGDYTVYYKVEGSANWNEVAAQTVNVTIAPGPYTVTFNANGGEGTMEPMQLTYDGDYATLTANTFTRTGYGFNGWNTLCLPFDVDLTTTDCPLYGATARTVTEASISGTTLNLTFSDPVTTIEAGIPYIIKWDGDGTSNIVNPVFEGVAIETTKLDYDTNTESVTTDERVRFCGTYKSTAFDSEDTSILLMGAANTLYYPTTGAGIGSFRAYFKIGGDDQALLARRLTSFSIDFGDDDNANGIISVSSETRGNADCWYSLDGRKLVGKPTQNGIYINNGKKVVFK